MSAVISVSEPPQEAADSPAMFTVAETAALLRISKSTAYNWVKDGSIPSFRARNARSVRVPVAALLRLIEAQATEATAA